MVEILRQSGGMSPRALIGGTWTPRVDDGLLVEVGFSGRGLGGVPTCVSVLSRPLVPGLPEEYAQPVVDALLDAGLPSGRIVIDRAGHDPVDSSPSAFRAAAELLAVVLVAESVGGDVEAIAGEAIGRW
jgi:hypothetical protein